MTFKCTFAFKNGTEKVLYPKTSTVEENAKLSETIDKVVLALSNDLNGHVMLDGCVIRLSEVIWLEVEEIEQKTEES